MRVVFIGASKFGLRCLEKIAGMPDQKIVGIVTNREIFSISYNPQGVKNVLYADCLSFAEKQQTPFFVMKDRMTDPQLIQTVKDWSPDFILVVGWYHMVPKVIRAIAPVAGLHASLLPDYSGGAPLVWAIIHGEQKTGITFFMFGDGIDSGDIIAQKTEPIYLNDTIASLYARIERHGLYLLEEYLPKIAKKELVLTVQDNTKRRIMPQRKPDDGEIDWAWSSLQIYNFIRAQTKPYPGAFTFFGDERIMVWEAKLFDFFPPMYNYSPEGGTILGTIDECPLNGILVAAPHVDCPLLLTQVGSNDKEIISGIEYAKRKNIRGGGILGRRRYTGSCVTSGDISGKR